MLRYLIIFVLSFFYHKCFCFEILKFNGKVEYSFDNKSWKKLLVKQKLKSGVWIKTGPKAKVTLLLPNRTQTILSRNTTVQLNDNQKKKVLVLSLIWVKYGLKLIKNPLKLD